MNLSNLLLEPWAISEDGYRAALRAAVDHNDLARFKGAPAEAALNGALVGPREFEIQNGVAIIPIMGPLTREAWWPGDRSSLQWIGEQLALAVSSDQVQAIVLHVDTQGGELPGIEALAAQIRAAGEVKPVTAVVEGMAASAGYWLASQASWIVASRTSMLGSIGVLMTITDFSKLDEAMGIEEITIVSSQSPFKDIDPKVDEDRARIQTTLDGLAEIFIAEVSASRGVSVETVAEDFGQGWVLLGEAAIEVGMADEIATLEQIISRAGAPSSRIHGTAARGPEGEDMKIEVSEITAELLAEHCGDLVLMIGADAVAQATADIPDADEIIAEATEAGATDERTRVLGIQAAAEGCGNAELVSELVGDPTVTVEAAQARLFEADKVKRTARLDALKGDENKLKAPPASNGADDSASDDAASVKAAGDYAHQHRIR